MQNKTERIAYIGLLITLALICSYIETVIVIPAGVPGVKLGLANGITIVVLCLYGYREAFLVSLLRILISTFLFGNVSALLFSVAGFLCSFAVMVLLKKINIFSIIGISVAGGVSHNIGQMAAAAIIMETAGLLYYIPILIVAGLGFGIAVGIIAGVLIKRLKKMGIDRKNI